MRHSIDLIVGTLERRQDQRAAFKIAGIADRGNRNVDARAIAGERGEGSGDEHGSHVFRFDLFALDVDTEPLEHVSQGIFRER